MVYDNSQIKFQFENEIIEVLKISNEIINKPYPMHNHGENCFEFHYVLSGNAIIETPDKMISVGKGTFYVTGPLMQHAQFPDSSKNQYTTESDNSNNTYKEYGIYFNVVQTSLHDNSIIESLKKQSFIISENNYKIYNIFKQIIFEIENQKIGYVENIISLLRLLIVASIRLSPDVINSEISCNNLDKALNNKRSLLIDDLFMNSYANLTLSKLASEIGLSERQTQRYLSKVYGKTFNQKKLEARMSAAKVMLMDYNLSIDDIAYKLGYAGNSKFLSTFKNYYGITARQFRKDSNFINK